MAVAGAAGSSNKDDDSRGVATRTSKDRGRAGECSGSPRNREAVVGSSQDGKAGAGEGAPAEVCLRIADPQGGPSPGRSSPPRRPPTTVAETAGASLKSFGGSITVVRELA